MLHRKESSRLVAILVGLGLIASPVAFAQEGQPSGPSATIDASDVTDAEIVRFAEANKAVNSIMQESSEAFDQAENADEANAIQSQVQDQLISAVEEAGLSAQRYNMLMQLAQSDPDFQDRMLSVMDG